MENMALCIDNEGHAEIEVVDKNSKKCSDLTLNKNSKYEISLSDQHCGSCNDFLLKTNSHAFNNDFSDLQPILLNLNSNYTHAKNINKIFHSLKKYPDFNNPTYLSIISVKIIC